LEHRELISKNWTPQNLAWAAGLFEGEGSISVKAQTAQLQLSMSDEDVVRRLHLIMGVGSFSGPYQDKRKPTYKPMWTWSVGGARKVQAVLAAFWNQLGDRRKAKAKEAIIACSKWTHPRDKVQCGRGHRFTEENSYAWNGHRQCKLCMSLFQAAAAAKRRLKRTGRVDYYL
jgi:hypothetical protein